MPSKEWLTWVHQSVAMAAWWLGCIEEKFSQVHGNVTHPSRCLCCIKGTFSQVHSNVTHPSRYLGCIKETFSQSMAISSTHRDLQLTKLVFGPWYWKWALKKHRLCLKQCRFLFDHVQIWPRQHIQQEILFSLFPNPVQIVVIMSLFWASTMCVSECLYPISCSCKVVGLQLGE